MSDLVPGHELRSTVDTLNRVAFERDKLRRGLTQTAQALRLLLVDYDNDASPKVVRRELVCILDAVLQVTGDQAEGQGDGNVDR